MGKEELISLAEVWIRGLYNRDEIVSISDFYVENEYSLVAFGGRWAILFSYEENYKLRCINIYRRYG